MRVLLIAVDDVAAYNGASAKTYPKLGLISLIGYAREHCRSAPRLEFTYIDMLLEALSFDALSSFARELKPDIVGMSALSFNEDAFHRAAAALRKACPKATILGGGPYVSSSREKVLDDLNVDMLVLDEGEETFAQLLDTLDAGGDPHSVAGLCLRGETGPTLSGSRALIEPLARIPLPAYDLIDFDAYARNNPHLEGAGRFAPIVTSRGCPFRCIYCHALHGKTTRFRSADNVLEEIELLYHKHGVRLFYVYDDIFNLDKRRAKDICRGIISRKLDIGLDFLNGLRGDMMDTELVDLLLDAGAYYIAYAVETATPRLQDKIRKHNDLDQLADTIQQTVRSGDGRCVVATYNMIGFPSESEDEVWNTILYNLELSHHIADIAITIPQENTELFQVASEEGFERETSRTVNYMGEVPLSASKHINKARLGELLNVFKDRFYDDARKSKLLTLSRLQGPDSARKFLGGFLRGYIKLSGLSLGSVNATLYSGQDTGVSAASGSMS